MKSVSKVQSVSQTYWKEAGRQTACCEGGIATVDSQPQRWRPAQEQRDPLSICLLSGSGWQLSPHQGDGTQIRPRKPRGGQEGRQFVFGSSCLKNWFLSFCCGLKKLRSVCLTHSIFCSMLLGFPRKFKHFFVTRFCSSPLWLRQALPAGAFPSAVQEKDFIIPGDILHCNDSRRNFTDFQETSQWLGGISVPKSILSNLCGA